MESVRDRFVMHQAMLDESLGNDPTLIIAFGALDLETNDENANEYKIPLVVWDSYVYFLTDDAGEVFAGLVVTAEDAYDQYKGKRQAFAMSYALAPTPTTEGEQWTDRVDKIDAMNPSQSDFGSFGDMLSKNNIMLSSGMAEGFVTYFALRMNATEDQQ